MFTHCRNCDAPAARDDLDRPPREFDELAGVDLNDGERGDVKLGLDERAFGRFDAETG